MNIENVKQNLLQKGYQVQIFSNKEEAKVYLLNGIQHTTVGIGGSVTIQELDILDDLKKNNTVYWHWDKELLQTKTDVEIRRLASTTDIYLSSVNGMSEQGDIVNIDGFGNRVASMCYGHRKLYFILGTNKIAEDLSGAISRAKNVAAVKNATRLNKKTPCAVKQDHCYNCNSPERICRSTVILERAVSSQEIEVILISENLGY